MAQVYSVEIAVVKTLYISIEIVRISGTIQLFILHFKSEMEFCHLSVRNPAYASVEY